MKKLEARFGPYQPPQEMSNIQEQGRYQAAPLHRSPERGNLYAEYRQNIEDRKVRLEAAKEQDDAALAAIREQWAAKRKEIEAMHIAKKNRRNLLSIARKHEAEAVARARLAVQPEREAVRRDIPFTSWNGFLQHKAEQGNETALAILRSKGKSVAEEKEAAPKKDWSQHGREQFLSVKADHAAKERAALELEGVSGKAKKRLLAVLRMERLAAENGLDRFEHKVDRNGAVVFTLSGGGKIRDTGGEVLFSPDSERLALLYAQKKWGRSIIIEGNHIMRDQKRKPEMEREKEQRRGMDR
jgi:hypothetical protein